LLDDDFPRFTPKEERFESLLDFIDAETVRDDLGKVGAVLLQTPQIDRHSTYRKYSLPTMLRSGDMRSEEILRAMPSP
jgi:hypothetical protein